MAKRLVIVKSKKTIVTSLPACKTSNCCVLVAVATVTLVAAVALLLLEGLK